MENGFSDNDSESQPLLNMSYGCTAFWCLEAHRDVGIFASSVCSMQIILL